LTNAGFGVRNAARIEATTGGRQVVFAPRRAGILALAASLAFAPAAHAAPDYRVLGNDGAWEVGTGTDSQGNAYCSIQDQSQDQSHGLLLLIYPLGDDPSFEVHVFKNSWSIPANADVPAKFNFSDGGSWDADGQAADDGSSVVDYTIDMQDMQDFLADFSTSDSLDIVFTNGTEPKWTENLTGSAKATQDLLRCSSKLLGGDGGGSNTRPFSQPPDNGAGSAGNDTQSL
jgi:hypothetical protein